MAATRRERERLSWLIQLQVAVSIALIVTPQPSWADCVVPRSCLCTSHPPEFVIEGVVIDTSTGETRVEELLLGDSSTGAPSPGDRVFPESFNSLAELQAGTRVIAPLTTDGITFPVLEIEGDETVKCYTYPRVRVDVADAASLLAMSYQACLESVGERGVPGILPCNDQDESWCTGGETQPHFWFIAALLCWVYVRRDASHMDTR